jgi:tetratricopeptide (TPR) repeat protein
MHRGELEQAVAAYERAHKLEPRAVAPLVNVAIAYNMLGNSAGSEEALRRALEVEPDHPTANLSLGLLLGAQGRMREAEAAFRSAMESRPDALAAYNLCVLLSADRIEEAVGWCRSAVELQPEEPEYGYTLGFYLHQNGDTDDAIRVLAAVIEEHPTYADAYLLLGGIYRLQRNLDEAETVYLRGLSNEGMSGEARQRLESELRTVRADRRGDP